MEIKRRDSKKTHRPGPTSCDTPPPAEAGSGDSGPARDTAAGVATMARPGIFVHHGIHQGTYQVTGMTVAQVRRMFARLMNVGPDAVAVIGGEIVENEDSRVLLDTDQMLSFVQKSSVKGAVKSPTKREAASAGERLDFKDGTVELHLPGSAVRQVPTSDVIQAIQLQGIRGLNEEPLAETVRWNVACGPASVVILELKPGIRWIRWVSPESPIPYGPEALYEEFRLSTPYVIVKVPFCNGRMHPTCEVFYRNEPLRDLDSELYWCNLLNVSPGSYGCTSWFCTQYLARELKKRLMLEEKTGKNSRGGKGLALSEQLDAVVAHLFGGGFNLSSEMHEGSSCFSKARQDGIDERVTDVRRWQEESVKDPNFSLGVSWKPTGLSVGKLIYKQLDAFRLPRNLADTSELINVLLSRPAAKGA